MGKIKPGWVKTDIPKSIKIKYHWKAMMETTTYLSWQQAMASYEWDEKDKKYWRESQDTYKRLKDEIFEMPVDEIDTLSPDLKSWVKDVRGLDRGPQERPVDEHAHAEVDTSYIGLAGEERERAIAHDVAIFRKSDMIMNEELINNLVGRVIFAKCYQEQEVRRSYDLVFFFTAEGNRYISDTLREVTEKLCHALEDFLAFITDAAELEPDQQYIPDYQHDLWPDLFVDFCSKWSEGEKKIRKLRKAGSTHKAEDVEEEMVDMFSEQFHQAKVLYDELSQLTISVLAIYREYRSCVRQALFV